MPVSTAEVKRIVGERLGIAPDQVRDDARLGEPPWNSLGHLTVLTGLADAYRFTLDAELVQRLTSIDAIVAYLAGRDG